MIKNRKKTLRASHTLQILTIFDTHTSARATTTFRRVAHQLAVHSLLYCHAARRRPTFTAHHHHPPPCIGRRHHRHHSPFARKTTPRVVCVVYRETARRRHSNVLFCSVVQSRTRTGAPLTLLLLLLYLMAIFHVIFTIVT